jgi:hypothetical protein
MLKIEANTFSMKQKKTAKIPEKQFLVIKISLNDNCQLVLILGKFPTTFLAVCN